MNKISLFFLFLIIQFAFAQSNTIVNLSIGNQWHYSGFRESSNWYSGPYSKISKIMGDTIVNNIIHYQVETTFIHDTSKYSVTEYCRSDSGRYAIGSLPVIYSTIEMRYDSSIVSDTSWYLGGMGTQTGWIHLSQGFWYGQNREIQEWGYYEDSHGYSNEQVIQTAKGLGIIKESGIGTDISGNSGQAIDSLSGVLLDMIPFGKPSPPMNLYTVVDSFQVILYWSPNSEPDVISYMIYEGEFRDSLFFVDSTSNRQDTSLTIDGLQSGTTYYFRVKAKNSINDTSDLSLRIKATTLGLQTSIWENRSDYLSEFNLLQNYPNPFNHSTIFEIAVPEKGNLQLQIFDITGKKVFEQNIGDISPAVHKIQWNGFANSGTQVAGGIYFYRFIFEEIGGKKNIQTRKMMLLQ